MPPVAFGSRRRPIYVGGGSLQRNRNQRPETAGLQSISVDGVQRSYRVLLPKTYDGTKKLPVIYAFHGEGGTALSIVNSTELADVADRSSFILVLPEGKNNDWNLERTIEAENRDVVFVRMLLKQLECSYAVDAEKCFALGFSKGGEFVYRAASEMSMQFSAIAVVSATLSKHQAKPVSSVSVMHVHGLEDRVYPFSGSSENGISSKARCGVPETIDSWLESNRMTENSVELEKRGRLTIIRYANGNNSVHVELILVQGLGHQWPTADACADEVESGAYQQVSVEDEIIGFFSQYGPA